MPIIDQPTQFLTFMLGGGYFAINIGDVREVIEYMEPTTLSNAPHEVLGMIRVRGETLTVIDLRAKIGTEQMERTVNTCIILIDTVSDSGEALMMGALVDAVKEVVIFSPDQVTEPPKSSGGVNEFLMGVGKQKDQFTLILDTESVFLRDAVGGADDVMGDGLEGAEPSADDLKEMEALQAEFGEFLG
ncbi:MAG: chemotaxis protein CheW [Magnetococcales bacterium]|nr:chemotaxis protein CheW [Magnetococcales bacterium]